MPDREQMIEAALTNKDLGVAIEILKRVGISGIGKAHLMGDGAETESLAEAAESVARVVQFLRRMRDGEALPDPERSRLPALWQTLEAENERYRLESREWAQWREDSAAEFKVIAQENVDLHTECDRLRAIAEAAREVVDTYPYLTYEAARNRLRSALSEGSAA